MGIQNKQFHILLTCVFKLRSFNIGGFHVAKKVAKSLSEDLLPLLQKERLITLATIDCETGAPNVSALSWIYAPDVSTLRLAVDQQSRIIDNINKESAVVVNVFGGGSCYSIAGKARVAVERIDQIPIKLARIDIAIHEVRDVMFYGSRISTEPAYEKTYDAEAAQKLDEQVMNALSV